MTGISHRQAHLYIQAALDGQLREREQEILEGHLKSCTACQAYSDELSGITINLQQALHARWDPQHTSTKPVIENVLSQRRNIMISNRIRKGLGAFAILATLFLVALISSYTINRLLPTPSGALPPSIASETARATPSSTLSSPLILTGTPVSPTAQASLTSSPFPPNNGLIVFVSEISGNPEIYSMNPDGSNVTELTKSPAKNYSPVWSPDGKRIAFISERNAAPDIFSMNPNGSGLTQLTNKSGFNGYFYWSPDGRKIAYTTSSLKDPNRAEQLFVINADGSGKTDLMDVPGSFLGWSPNSQQIVYSIGNQETGAVNSMYVINADGTGRLELASQIAPVDLIHWQDDQHFYITTNNEIKQIYRFSTDGTAPVLIASISGPDTGNPLPAPNVLTWFGHGPNLTYIISMNNSWTWYRIEGTNKTYLAEWSNSAGKCQTNQDNWSSYLPSPDETRGFVGVYCSEGMSWFYLVSADGAKVAPLLQGPTPMQDLEEEWSPNGQYVLLALGDNQTAHDDLYMLDVEKALKDPIIAPVRLTNDAAWKYGMAWQPKP